MEIHDLNLMNKTGFHKPAHTDMTIPDTFLPPYSRKLDAYHSYVLIDCR